MQQESQIIEQLEHEHFIVAKRFDGIFHVYLKDNAVLDLKLQSEMLYHYDIITKGKKSYFIFEAGHKCDVTKQARDNAIVIEDVAPIKASVVYVQNMVYRMIASFFYKINKPKQPYLIVSNFEDGIEWLNSLKESEAKNIQLAKSSKSKL